jgi:phospholipase/lecithinase/hemolysin
MLEKLEDTNKININEFDLFKLFDNVVKKANKLSFSNSRDACFSSATASFHPDCNYGLNADEFIFFDEIHPTAKVHKMFGDAFYKALSDDGDDEKDENEDNDEDKD